MADVVVYKESNGKNPCVSSYTLFRETPSIDDNRCRCFHMLLAVRHREDDRISSMLIKNKT